MHIRSEAWSSQVGGACGKDHCAVGSTAGGKEDEELKACWTQQLDQVGFS